MKITEFSWFALSAGLGASMLVSCAGSQPPIGSPSASSQNSTIRSAGERFAPDSIRRGIYVSDVNAVLGYRANNSANEPPICSLAESYPGGIAADSDGNLIVTQSAQTVTVYKGPRMCGPQLGSFSDPYGQPVDAASIRAATGTIVVANVFDASGPGSIAVCTLAGGCTKNLRGPSSEDMYEVAAVALADNGDCWASSTNSAGTAKLTYFKRCSGHGRTATGYENTYYGGLDIDSQGHLLAISAFDGKLYVYKGCAPACALAAGPYALVGEAVYGHLNEKSTMFVASDFLNGQVNVYAYTPSSLTYLYHFNNGLSGSTDPTGATYNRRAKE
jgi:hypothetical protein